MNQTDEQYVMSRICSNTNERDNKDSRELDNKLDRLKEQHTMPLDQYLTATEPPPGMREVGWGDIFRSLIGLFRFRF
jgi:hypothetical protein